MHIKGRYSSIFFRLNAYIFYKGNALEKEAQRYILNKRESVPERTAACENEIE